MKYYFCTKSARARLERFHQEVFMPVANNLRYGKHTKKEKEELQKTVDHWAGFVNEYRNELSRAIARDKKFVWKFKNQPSLF